MTLLEYIRSIVSLTDDGWKILADGARSLSFEKGDYLLREGELCQSVFFIEKGYCRTFHVIDGDEINTAFYFENTFATNIGSLTKKRQSDYAIQACEYVSAVAIDAAYLLNAYKLSHEIETFGRTLLSILLAKQEEYSTLFTLLTPEQRYQHVVGNYPEIIQRVSSTQLASYLGMARETLSRIRSKRNA